MYNRPNGVSFKWLAAVLCTALLTAFGWFQTQQAKLLGKTIDTCGDNAERVTRVETRQEAIESRLLRIDAKLDVLLARD